MGLGLESAAFAYRLDFVFLARERYDLVMHAETAQPPAVNRLIEWLGTKEGRQFIARHKSYENVETGLVRTGPNRPAGLSSGLDRLSLHMAHENVFSMRGQPC